MLISSFMSLLTIQEKVDSHHLGASHATFRSHLGEEWYGAWWCDEFPAMIAFLFVRGMSFPTCQPHGESNTQARAVLRWWRHHLIGWYSPLPSARLLPKMACNHKKKKTTVLSIYCNVYLWVLSMCMSVCYTAINVCTAPPTLFSSLFFSTRNTLAQHGHVQYCFLH